MAENPGAPAAGWYPDPERAYTWRYWDGGGWTEHRAPMDAVAPVGSHRIPTAVLYAIGLLVAAGVGVGATLLATSGDDDGSAVTTVTTTTPGEPGERTGDGASADTTPLPETTTEAEVTDPDNSCNALGINSEELKEGSCTWKGQGYVVVNRNSTLTLDQLTARLVGISTADTLQARSFGPLSASGTFVIARVEITNTTNKPQTYDSSGDASSLTLGRDVYTEDFEVENGAATDSFVRRSKELQPRESMTGTLVYDVPADAVDHLETDGYLTVANFRDDDASQRPEQLGLIRTYH
jgi:Domain of unknown function (DUF4352)/Protein of unknown function (DUF2510)